MADEIARDQQMSAAVTVSASKRRDTVAAKPTFSPTHRKLFSLRWSWYVSMFPSFHDFHLLTYFYLLLCVKDFLQRLKLSAAVEKFTVQRAAYEWFSFIKLGNVNNKLSRFDT